MSKYKCLMPAGMSDDDDDDDECYDDVFYPVEETKPPAKKSNYTPRTDSTKKETTVVDFEASNKERNYEDNLVKACTLGQLEPIREHLEQNDVDKYLYTGWTLLLYAASFVEPELVEYLLVHGANPNKHRDGFTPLMALCNSLKGTTKKSLECLNYLIEAKADANATSKRRETALMYACMHQDADFVKELIKYVQNIDACDSDGRTALRYAAAANKPDNVKILLIHNANTSLTDVYNLSAKDIANTKGFTEISALLGDEDEKEMTCLKIETTTWRDLFPNWYPVEKEVLDYDISVILYGMGLEKYSILFQGMDIKTFLQLTEDDLFRLGIDISVHRHQFLKGLEKFHNRKWRLDSFGNIKKKKDSYTIYDGVISLTNAKKQISVIASSFQYIKNNLLKAASENIVLSPIKRIEYEEELRKTQNTLKLLKSEMIQIKMLAKQIDKENNIGVPATWINSKKNFSWTITIISTAFFMGGLSAILAKQKIHI